MCSARVRDRRHIRHFAGAAALIAVVAGFVGGASGAERPNVLLILGDDHAAYALGAFGNPHARTPNLDRLAGEGALFQRAYCNSPVCTASRQSLLTGRYPHSIRTTLLATPLPDEEITLAEVLRDAGYETGAIGKMHFNSGLRHGFDVRLDLEEHRWSLVGRPRGFLPPETETLGHWRPFKDPAAVWLNGSCLPYAARADDMAGRYFAEEAARSIRRPRSRPFFLVASFYEPHSPFHFPIESAGRLDPQSIQIPQVGRGDGPQVPLIFRGLSVEEKKRIAAAYYTSVEFLDSNIGIVLDALNRSGAAEDTLVIYAGDHGYLLGHHGRFEKHCFFEEAVRAPLIVRWPRRVAAGQLRPELIELVDLFPTVVEACGAALPPDRHGRSLLGLFEPVGGASAASQARAGAREHVVSFYHENEEAMVRAGRWKLIASSGKRAREDGYRTENPTPGRWRRLYDIEMDPLELRDLAAEPVRAGTIDELERILLETFESTAPASGKAPPGLARLEALDWYLVPPEVRGRR